MEEKQIWKWVFEKFPDEKIAEFGRAAGLQIKGFRHISVTNKFKVLRPRLISALVNLKDKSPLIEDYDALENKEEVKDFQSKNVKDLLTMLENGVKPSDLLFTLLSEEEEKLATDLYIHLEELGLLEQLEHKDGDNHEKVQGKYSKQEPEKNENDELKAARAQIKTLEKKLKKLEQKTETMKNAATSDKESTEKLKKQWKDEKKSLNQELHAVKLENEKLAKDHASLIKTNTALKTEIDRLKKDSDGYQAEVQSLKAQAEENELIMKDKNAKIADLHAMCLKLKTHSSQPQKESDEPILQIAAKKNPSKAKIAIVGDPKNAKINQQEDYDMVIVEATELEAQIEKGVFNGTEQIWLLTYRTNIKTQRRIKSVFSDEKLREFATFVELEKYMMKG